MVIITAKVAGSWVAMLTMARMVRRTLKGFQSAVHKMDRAASGRSATEVLGPCCLRASAAASWDRPTGLHVGSMLSTQVRQKSDDRMKTQTRIFARQVLGQTVLNWQSGVPHESRDQRDCRKNVENLMQK